MPPGPAAVRPHVLRPLPWVAAMLALSGVFVATDVLGAREQARHLRGALHTSGRVGGSYRGGAEVPISYVNPVTDQHVETTTYVWQKRLPQAGDTVAIEVLPDDPDEVVIAGDRFGPVENLPWTVMWPLFPFVSMAARWHHVRRCRALARTPATFAMLGALFPPGRASRQCRLALYPIDAGPGAASLCTVPVLTTGGIGVPSPCFPVEVKGIARPAGRVVARAGEVVLWPARRALLTSLLRRPPALGAAEHVPLVPSPSRPATCRTSRWVLWGPELGALSAALVLLGLVAAVTAANFGESERARRRSRRVVAEVVARDTIDGSVAVRFTDPTTGATRQARAPSERPEEATIGRRYPALVSHMGVRLAREPYDPRAPIGWAATPVAVAGPLLARRVLLVRRNLALRAGPWSEAAGWVLGGTAALHGHLALGAPGHPLRAVAVVHRLDLRHLRGAGAVVVAVAGPVEPGSPGLVQVGERLVVPVGPLRPPPA